jgi:GMP synthase PP-ATPase subunit
MRHSPVAVVRRPAARAECRGNGDERTYEYTVAIRAVEISSKPPSTIEWE